MRFLLCMLAIWAGATLGAPITYDVTLLLRRQAGHIPLLGGAKVSTVALKAHERLLFEDLHPNANWEHPARFKLEGANGKLLKVIDVLRPPLGLEDAPIVSGDPIKPQQQIQFAIDNLGGALRVAKPDHFHALLINGRADLRHWNDFSFLYRVLTQVYGYAKTNITVVDGIYKDHQPDLDGDGSADIQYASTRAGLTEAMTALASKLKPSDQLLLAVNDHGGSFGGESTIILTDGEVKVSEFSQLLQAIPVGRVLSLFEQCYSGGFVRPSLGANRVAMSAATDREFSWASADLNWDEWIYHAISAFAMQTHDGKRVESDTNADGRISAQEAFAYSVKKDVERESPLLEARRNSGEAALIGLSF